MMKEFQAIFTKVNSVKSIWGFGSFFRSNRPNDLDLLITLSCPKDQLLEHYYNIKGIITTYFQCTSIKIDLVILTDKEYEKNPLKVNDKLIPIYERNSS